MGSPSVGPSVGEGRDGEEKSTKGSIFFFSLVAVLAAVYFNQEHVMPVFGHIAGVVRQMVAAAPTGTNTTAPAPIPLDEDLMFEPVSKKKAKLRKA